MNHIWYWSIAIYLSLDALMMFLLIDPKQREEFAKDIVKQSISGRSFRAAFAMLFAIAFIWGNWYV